MQLHQIRPKHKKRKRKRVARGGKRGTYSGRGMKGQRSRAGRRLKPVIRVFIKRYPKLRGYGFNPVSQKPSVVNVEVLERRFNPGEKVNPQTLLERRIIRRIKGRTPQVKILGKGELTKSLIIENCLLSASAREKISKAKGTIK